MILTSGRITTVAIGLPLVLGTAAWSALTMAGVFAHASSSGNVAFSWHGGPISVATNSGSVHVVGGSGNEVEVGYTEHYGLKKPTVTTSRSSRGVQLVARCPGGLFSNNCSVDYVITVPRAATLQLHSGDGGVQLTGTAGPASIDVGDGGVELANVSGQITAHTGDGGIHGTGVRSASLDAATGDGGIDIRWVRAPRRVVVTTGDGGIDLSVPSDSGPYRVVTHTGDGGVQVSVPTDQTATASLTARTGDGGITIRAAG